MQICINILFARFSVEGFSILVNISFADLAASVMPALSNPCRIDSFCRFRYVCISTIERVCKDFKSDIFIYTLTSPRATPFFNCSLIRSAYYVLNLWEKKVFAFWLIEISRGWNLLIKLCSTITNSQSFQTQWFNFGFILTFEGIHHNQWVLLLWVTKLFFLGFKVRKDDFLEQSDTFFIIGPIIWSEGSIKATREIILGYTTLSFTTIDKVGR